MNPSDLKARVCEVIDGQREKLIAIGEAVWKHPETGFQEFETARLVQRTFDAIGLQHRDGLAVTGVRADLQGAAPGPTLALLGEMDALILPEHPDADPDTGAVHACGHNAQLAGLMGAAMGLHQSGVMSQLAGKVALMAVPAEEYIQVEYRCRLRDSGKIGLLGGKQELIRLGVFDDVDLAMMIHTSDGRQASTRNTMNGFIAQTARFKGRAAHAGSAPHQGVNALNAASLAIQAIHAQRETFEDQNHVRVHTVMTHGGNSVSIVPEDARLETLVRAAGLEAAMDAAAKTLRCYQAGALAVGADVSVTAFPGYLPLNDCRSMSAVFAQNVKQFVGPDGVGTRGHLSSSTDMGDVTQIMPACHPGIGGTEGKGHTTGYRIVDPELAYVVPAKVLAMCAIDLLSDQAATARNIMTKHPPAIPRNDYQRRMQKQFYDQTYRYRT